MIINEVFRHFYNIYFNKKQIKKKLNFLNLFLLNPSNCISQISQTLLVKLADLFRFDKKLACKKVTLIVFFFK